MDEKFKTLIEGLHMKYESLIAMPPVTIDTAPNDCPIGGVYLFSENGKHLYAGRTKRKIKTRLKGHVSTAKDCPFAWHLAREKTGSTRATYKKEGSRNHLLSQPRFKQAYEEAKTRIRKMDVRFVGEPDPLKQALLEIYVAVVSKAKFNDFDTH
ncbi:MAG: hypothetical protein PHI33_03435 [Smithellaceae bacterium]|nr:hypothetical protein [Smithellaceae bacterium]